MFKKSGRLKPLLGVLLLMIVLSFGSCDSGVHAPDVSGIKVQLQSRRLDKDIYKIDTNHISDGLRALQATYPDVLNFYLDTMMGFGIQGNYVDTNEGIRGGLKVFLTYKDFVGLHDTINAHYPDTKDVEASLTKGFQNMKYYFPDYKVPQLVYFTSGLNKIGVLTYGKEVVFIGLDMFLGRQYPYYRSVSIPAYMDGHLTPAYIPVAVFSAIYQDDHTFQFDNKTLLDMMIQKGKEQYYLHKILPGVPDSTLFGFTQTQIDWSTKNEAYVYNFFIANNMLYEKELRTTMPYISDGPFAKSLEPDGPKHESPGNIGTWIGYRIVSAYMAQHPKTTLSQLLMQNIESPQFLNDSKYRPGR